MKIIKWKKWIDELSSDENFNGRIVIPTPIGMIQHKLESSSENQLNFWIGHTNFDLTDAVVSIIKNVKGVEIFNLFTPYRFRICIGEAFKTKEVQKNIEIALGCRQQSNLKLTRDQITKIKNTKEDISRHKFWAIYILPNGKFEYCFADDKNDFIADYQFYKSMEDTVGGALLSPTKEKMVY